VKPTPRLLGLLTAVSLLAALPPAATARAASVTSPSVSPTVVVRTVIEGIAATDPTMVCPNVARYFKKFMKQLAIYQGAHTAGRNSCREVLEDLYTYYPPKPTRIAKLRWVGMQGDDIALVRLTDTKGKKELIVLVVERGAWKYRGGVCQYGEKMCTEMGAWHPSGSRTRR
jgi:hypothetical protein